MPDLETLSREELYAIIRELFAQNAVMTEQIQRLQEENEKLREQLKNKGAGSGPPAFVKVSRPQHSKAERPQRKKRKSSFHRPRETPTEVKEHALERCPDCGHKLQEGWLHTTRQQIEIPPVQPRIIEHRLMARYCGICKKTHVPTLGATEGLIGKHRLGINLMSLMANLSIQCRVPVRSIRKLLKGLFGIELSIGEISEILHLVAKRGEEEVARLLGKVRASPVAYMDETSWREDGVNGQLWCVATEEVRFYLRDKSRSAEIAKEILADFKGVLVCDFYAAYSWYLGPMQRCWAHLKRDLDKLLEEHPKDKSVHRWVKAILETYRRARASVQSNLTTKQRQGYRRRYEEKLLALAKPYLDDKEAPQHRLAKRIERHQKELFTFTDFPGVSSTNNAAERAIRPAVVLRKVSGGTRSEKGSKTKAALLSLFGTWELQGRNLLEACATLLRGTNFAPSTSPI